MLAPVAFRNICRLALAVVTLVAAPRAEAEPAAYEDLSKPLLLAYAHFAPDGFRDESADFGRAELELIDCWLEQTRREEKAEASSNNFALRRLRREAAEEIMKSAQQFDVGREFVYPIENIQLRAYNFGRRAFPASVPDLRDLGFYCPGRPRHLIQFEYEELPEAMESQRGTLLPKLIPVPEIEAERISESLSRTGRRVVGEIRLRFVGARSYDTTGRISVQVRKIEYFLVEGSERTSLLKVARVKVGTGRKISVHGK